MRGPRPAKQAIHPSTQLSGDMDNFGHDQRWMDGDGKNADADAASCWMPVVVKSVPMCVASHTQVGYLDHLPGPKDGAVSAKRGPLESGRLLGITSARPWVLTSQTVLRCAKAVPDHQNAHCWVRVWEWEASSGQGCFALWLSARGKPVPQVPSPPQATRCGQDLCGPRG